LVPDTELYNAITEKLAIKPPVRLQTSDLENLTELNLGYLQNVKSLEGLQYAKNLNTLDIVLGTYNDLGPISDLTKLTSLKLGLGAPVKLEQILKLTQLTTLLVSGSNDDGVPYFDIKLIENFPQLKELSIKFAGLTSIPNFPALTQLEKLDLTGNKITDLTSLQANRHSVIDLNLKWNPLQNIDALAGANRFRKLDLSGTSILSLSPILGMVNGQAGDELIAESSCLYTGKHAIPERQIEALRESGVLVNVRQRNESDKNLMTLFGIECDNPLKYAGLSLNVEDITSNSLTLKWALSGTVNLTAGICDIYFDTSRLSVNVPIISNENCEQTGSVKINAAYLPETIILKFNDGFGSHVQQIYVLPAKPVDLANPVIARIEWGQTVVKEYIKLLPKKDALIRVLVKADSELNPPNLQINIKNNSAIKTLPLEKTTFETIAGVVTISYSTIAPQEWMTPGVQFEISLADNDPVIVEPKFAPSTTLSVMIIPTSLGGAISQVPELGDIEKSIKGFWPFSDVQTKLHPLYIAKGGTDSLLFELEDLRIIEGTSVYYFGFFAHEKVTSFGGRAYGVTSKSAVGADYSNSVQQNGYLRLWEYIMLHELGHNFGREHINCGGPQLWDINYPYNVKSIGSLGISTDLKTYFVPQNYDAGGFADIMSYCYPQHVSDYTYQGVQDYLELNPPQPFTTNTVQGLQKIKNPHERSLYISGEIKPNGDTSLRRFVPLNHVMDADASSDYLIKVTFTNGTVVERHANVPTVDHPTPAMAQNFYATLPYGEIKTLHLLHNGRTLFSYEAAQNNKISQKLSNLKQPKVSYEGNNICLDWQLEAKTSASLIHLGATETTALILDDETGHACVNASSLNANGQWQVLIRQGLHTQEFLINR
jgi:Leucine-rich repeat (LRR) protein